MPPTRHDRRSRSARRTAEREGADRHRRQDRVRRSAVRCRPLGDRSVGVRVAEVGAANGGRRRRCSPASRASRASDTPRSCPIAAGLERAIAAGVTEVAIFAAASETFSRRNINQSIDESLATYKMVCADARAAGVRVRGYLSTCFVLSVRRRRSTPSRVADVAARLLDLGVFEVAVSDTIGAATPGRRPPCPRSRQRKAPSAADRPALSRHPRHRARQRARRPRLRRDDVR